MIAFQNTYADLPDRFYARVNPTPVAAPSWLAFNAPLAEHLNLSEFHSDEGLHMLSGNKVAPHSTPIAMAYAGQQFGNWSPQLGDGRALLLGELLDNDGERFDVQLKGSGRTPFSRSGDGRAWIGPVLREYLVSEAMAALNVPTTRALAAVSTGEDIVREAVLPGAVLTRVARSHMRVGTFQYFAIQRDLDALQALTDYAIDRLYPHAEGAAGLLEAVVSVQAELVAKWMSLGFIHGVMNTDNVSISGETIDYGPCAFMDDFAMNRVFSSIDEGGRYAYGNQPRIAHWNMVQFAEALLPLMNSSDAQEIVDTFPWRLAKAQERFMLARIGIDDPQDGDMELIRRLLKVMEERGLDFNNTFLALNDGIAPDEAWRKDWQARIGSHAQAVMAAANPAIIPRNHQIESVITAAVAGDLTPFYTLYAALQTPFVRHEEFAKPPQAEERVRATFCGT